MKRSFGQIIRERRIELGLTGKEVAASLGISPTYYSEIETGRASADAPRKYLDLLAVTLKLPIEYLYYHAQCLPIWAHDADPDVVRQAYEVFAQTIRSQIGAANGR